MSLLELERINSELIPLTPVQKKVTRLKYGLEDGRNWTHKQIATELGFSERTSQRQLKGALDRLRYPTRR
jgi:DNA-directed RNA polymerase sigma subunit (sigma70/sigma32)